MTKGTSAGYGDARANLECIATPVHDKLWMPRAPSIPLRRKGRELRLPRFICRQSATMAHAAPVDLHLRVLGSG